jgi:hypothetical protein
MATYDDVITALRAADKAGNAEDSARLAQIATRLKPQAAEQKSVEPGMLARAALTGGPLGLMAGGLYLGNKLQQGISNLAYEAGGKVTDVASSMGATPETAAKFGLAANVGVEAVPAVLGGAAIGKTLAPTLESGARRLMQSAIKPPLADLRSGRAARAIETMLEEGVNPTAGGVMKLRNSIDEINREITSRISMSPATIDKQAIYGPLKETLDKFTKQVNPGADIKAITSAWDEFVNHPLIAGAADIPVKLAQEMKQGTYRILAKKYGQLGSAETEAQKSLARGLKEGVASAVPEVAALNAQESSLINALSIAERRALMEANKNPGGLSWLAHNPVTWAAFMADKSALFKSLMARFMNAQSETIPAATAGTGIAFGGAINQRSNKP